VEEKGDGLTFCGLLGMQIEELGEAVEQTQGEFDELVASIQTYLDRWLPRLNDLIAKISERFTAALDRE